MKIQNSLPDSSRVWVYQSNVVFSVEQQKAIQLQLDNFIQSWEAHGTKLNAAAEIIYNRFIVLFVDESGQQATGCSIDKSVGFIKAIEKEFDLSLMNRMNIAYRNAEEVLSLRMPDFQQKIKTGEITKDSIVFNNLVQTKGEFLSNWEIPAEKSWHNNLFLTVN